MVGVSLRCFASSRKSQIRADVVVWASGFELVNGPRSRRPVTSPAIRTAMLFADGNGRGHGASAAPDVRPPSGWPVQGGARPRGQPVRGGTYEEFLRTTRVGRGQGDHEARCQETTSTRGRRAGYFGYFGAARRRPDEGDYSFDLGAWHVVALNSECAQVGGCTGLPQERWLRADLAAHRRVHARVLAPAALLVRRDGNTRAPRSGKPSTTRPRTSS